MGDTKKPHPLGFVIDGETIGGPLRHGVMIGGVLHKTFKLRAATVDDLLEAELEADVTKPINFNAQLLVRQLQAIGTFTDGFTLGLIRRLKPVDWRILRAAQSEVEELGEDEPADAPAS